MSHQLCGPSLTKLLLVLGFWSLTVAALCYFPDGTVAAGDTPCDPNAISTCCGKGFACLSNNICMLTEQVVGAGPGQSKYIRGSCTDKTWNNAGCPQFCVSVSRGDCLSCAMGMDKCPASNTDTEIYYCQDSQNNNGQNSASLAVACQSYTIAFKGVATPVTTIGYTVSLSSVSSSVSSLTSSSTSSSTSLSTPAAASPSSVANQDSHLGIGLGVGLGIGLGLIAVALFTFLFLRHRRSSSHNNHPSYDNNQHYAPAATTYDTAHHWKTQGSHPQAYTYEAHPTSPNELEAPVPSRPLRA